MGRELASPNCRAAANCLLFCLSLEYLLRASVKDEVINCWSWRTGRNRKCYPDPSVGVQPHYREREQRDGEIKDGRWTEREYRFNLTSTFC